MQAAREVDAAQVSQYVLDPDDWQVAIFRHAAKIALRIRTPENCVRLAGDALERLQAARHRLVVLPSTIELYIVGGALAEAKRGLEEYADALATARSVLGRQPRLHRSAFSSNGCATAGIFDIPTVGFGPADEAHSHSIDDQISLAQLGPAMAFYALYPWFYLEASSSASRVT